MKTTRGPHKQHRSISSRNMGLTDASTHARWTYRLSSSSGHPFSYKNWSLHREPLNYRQDIRRIVIVKLRAKSSTEFRIRLYRICLVPTLTTTRTTLDLSSQRDLCPFLWLASSADPMTLTDAHESYELSCQSSCSLRDS
jgi:hypothetical protein